MFYSWFSVDGMSQWTALDASLKNTPCAGCQTLEYKSILGKPVSPTIMLPSEGQGSLQVKIKAEIQLFCSH